jgi:hypothetical protein
LIEALQCVAQSDCDQFCHTADHKVGQCHEKLLSIANPSDLTLFLQSDSIQLSSLTLLPTMNLACRSYQLENGQDDIQQSSFSNRKGGALTAKELIADVEKDVFSIVCT